MSIPTAKQAFENYMKQSGLRLVYPEGHKMDVAMKESSFAVLERILTPIIKKLAQGSEDPEMAYINILDDLTTLDGELSAQLMDDFIEGK